MKQWYYDSVRAVDQAPIDRLRQFPREPDMLVYGLRSLGALIIRGLLQIYNHFEIVGHQNLRTNRSLVIVANHCSHIDTASLKCTIYDNRPSVCKKYSCANDKRIWKDFEKMELNEEWINENIQERKMRFSGAPMFTDQKLSPYKEPG